MVDPSLLLSREGIEWLGEDPAARSAIVIPAVFAEWLAGSRDLDLRALIAPEDLQLVDEHRARLTDILADVAVFSYRDAVALGPASRSVLDALLSSEDPVGELRADEWAFLQSHSSLASKLRRPLDAFRDAGATIVEVGRKAARTLIEQVIPAEHIPAILTPQLLARVTIKWVIVAGSGVGGESLGAVVGTLVGGPPGALIASKLTGLAAEQLTTAAVLAIDP